ncbi:MAG: carboxypeptidase-like regulatory domain-containing protein, partial [Rhodothermales bacterium]
MKRTNFTPLNTLFFLFLFSFCPLTILNAWGQDHFVYTNQPLKEVIVDIEARAGYRFLYRDALISDKNISLDAQADSLIPTLQRSLKTHSLDLKVDYSHKQILLSAAQADVVQQPTVVKGQVLDSNSGVRLPFANITWINEGQLYGVSTNESGFFHMQVNNKNTDTESVILAVSYVGYRPVRIRLNLKNPPNELSVRLIPERIQGQEVLVQSSLLHTDLDTTWHHLLYAGLFSPFGESSILRSLQTLPAVSMSTALSEGLNVRGSKADGFQVLLDGAPIYNQNHFYGMFDVFNEDALQTVGFYYDIAPASYFAPP